MSFVPHQSSTAGGRHALATMRLSHLQCSAFPSMRVCGVLIYSADTGVVHSRVAWLLDPGATINDVNVWTDVKLIKLHCSSYSPCRS